MDALSSRDKHCDVALGPFEQHARVPERHALADQTAASLGQHQVDRLTLGDVRQIGAGWLELSATPRARTPWRPGAHVPRDRLRGLFELQVLGLQTTPHPGAARGLDEAGEDQLALRRRAGQRLGQLD